MIQEFIEHIIRPLLSYPEKLQVEVISGDDRKMVRIYVASSDMQRVLGRQARTIKGLKSCTHILFPGICRDIIVDVAA